MISAIDADPAPLPEIRIRRLRSSEDYNFTIGFCIEEQAVAQAVATGDDRYSLDRRAGRLDRRTHPLLVQAGPEIFGDPDARFAGLAAVIVAAASRMRTSA